MQDTNNGGDKIHYFLKFPLERPLPFVPIPSKPRCSCPKRTHVMLKLYKIHRLHHPNRLRTRILILQKTEIISLTASLFSVLHVISLYIYIQFPGWSTRVSCRVRANDGVIFIHERQRVRQSSFNKRR
jgi:hypothetical protein